MKPIWYQPITIEDMKRVTAHPLMNYLGIELIAMGDDYLQAKMPVNDNTKQFMGCLHGGATCILAETVGNIAGHFCIDSNTQFCVGLEINVNHVKSMQNGFVFATARPFHLGQSTQVWDIQIRNDKQTLIAISRFTIAVLDKNKRKSTH